MVERKKRKILFFIQLPPPVHGVSKINRLIWESEIIGERFEKELLPIRFIRDLRSLRRLTVKKLIKFIRLCRQLNERIESFEPDCVYFSLMPVGIGFWRDFLFMRIIRRKGVKAVLHIHNLGMFRKAGKFPYRSFYRYVFNDAAIIHLSPRMLDLEIASAGLKPRVFTAINNGIRKEKMIRADRKDDIFRILFVSNLFPAKGIFILPEILARLLERDPGIQLRIVGDFMRDRYRRRFERLTVAGQYGDRLVMCGQKTGEQKWREYGAADVFIFPSRFRQECFPLVILEAMQAGLPVVSSRLGAIPEIISHGENGFLVEPEKPEDFAQYVGQLFSDRELCKRMGEANMKKFLDHYTSDIMERKIRDFLYVE